MFSPVAMELIADGLADRREALLRAAVATYAARIPAYGAAGPALLEEARPHTEEHFDLLCEVLRRGRPATARELAFVERHAARRARQGLGLADFLEAFRSFHTLVWDAVLELSGQS